MKTTIIALTALIALTSTAQASYRIVIPMEQSKGGPLPNSSINITPKTPSLPVENWQPAEPLYSEWVNVNDIYGCSNWTPATSTEYIGVELTQTATDCKQDQTRTKQNREQETYTSAYRNIGQPTSETNTIAAQSSRQATGTKELIWDCPTFERSKYNWMEVNGAYGKNVYLIWDGAYATTPNQIIDAQSPYQDTASGYIYRRGFAKINETSAIHYSICRTSI